MEQDALERLKVVCIKIVTGKASEDLDFLIYEGLRSELLKESLLEPFIPAFLKDSPDGNDLFDYLQGQSGRYAERRVIVREAFKVLENKSTEIKSAGLFTGFGEQLKEINSGSVMENWNKMIDRSTSDYSGCITSAKALIESTLRHILTDSKIPFGKDEDIGTLFSKVRSLIFPNLSSETDDIKKLVGSLSVMISKVNLIRNDFGDAHGHIDGDGKLDPLFVILFANISGTVSSFIAGAYKIYKDSLSQLPTTVQIKTNLK